MILPLVLPPGVYKNGTPLQSKGRWFDANGVRWFEGAMRPVGGWSSVQRTSPPPAGDFELTGVPRAMVGWNDRDGDPHLVIGTSQKAYNFTQGVLREINPADLTAGNDDTSAALGAYGAGAYGAFAYGAGDPAQAALTPAATWQLDTFGDFAVGVLSSDGRLLYWNPNP